MIKQIFGSCIPALLILLILSSPDAATTRKTDALEQKIIEISALRAKIIDKIDQGIELRAFLQDQLKQLEEEIKAELNRTGIHAHPVPLENLRINYNLKLIRHFRAYIDQLDKRIAYFQTGHERLKFYLRRIKDEIAIINTLQDLEIENLIGRIDNVLDEFIPETNKQIFDAFDIRLMPTEQVWNEIVPKPVETITFTGP
jgi:hypothetical protein